MSIVSVGPFVSKYRKGLVKLHKGVSASVYELSEVVTERAVVQPSSEVVTERAVVQSPLKVAIEESSQLLELVSPKTSGEVLKVYKGTGVGYATNEMMVASRNWNGVIVTPSSVNYDPETRNMEVVMRRGRECEYLNEEQVYQLIHNLAVMEAHGIVHGDIKPSNIVLIDDRPCMIDFGIISTRNEYAEDLQSIKDKTGHATAKYRIPGYDAINAALYALGVTICLLTGLIDRGLLESEVAVIVDINIGIITDKIEVHELTYRVEKQYKSLCGANPILRKLLCPLKWRVASFWQLLTVRVDTRIIYDECVENYRSCRITAIMMEGYFRYGVSDITTLVNITHGECMLWFINENHTGRLLDEYHSPGSWYTHHQPIHDREELVTRVTVDSPKIVMYHSEGMTMLMDTTPTVSLKRPKCDNLDGMK